MPKAKKDAKDDEIIGHIGDEIVVGDVIPSIKDIDEPDPDELVDEEEEEEDVLT